jgi:hypothetical protein
MVHHPGICDSHRFNDSAGRLSAMTKPPDPFDDSARRQEGLRVASILVIALGMTCLVITASWAALVGRSHGVGDGPLPEKMVDSMLLMNAGGPLIVVIGLALRRAPGSPVRQSLIAICLTGLWFYGKFMGSLFFS